MKKFARWPQFIYWMGCTTHATFAEVDPLQRWWEKVGWKAGWKSLQTDFEGALQQIGSECLRGTVSPKLADVAHWCLNHQRDWEGEVKVLLETERFYWVSYLDDLYPPALQELEDRPPILWSSQPLSQWYGDEALPRTALAVVGSRAQTYYGRMATEDLVSTVVREAGYDIVSGCAQGIDSTAHSSALEAGGRTIGVLPCGLAEIPPRVQRAFASDKALLVSEFPPHTPIEKWRYPQRNRIIAGLAKAVLVIEAQHRSGTLITASAALAQGKEVMVLTQPYTSPRAAGVIRLAQQGATLVATAQDIYQVVSGESESSHQGQQSIPIAYYSERLRGESTQLEQTVFTILCEQGGRMLTTECQKQCNISADQEKEWYSTLVSLELRGIITNSLGVIQLQTMIQS